MEQKNPILNFRLKNVLNPETKIEKSNLSKTPNYSTTITKTRESIDMTEHS